MTGEALTDALRETLVLFEDPGVPQTTPEVAARLDLGRRSTYNRLDRLVEHGRLETKKVGASARVWWQPPTSADTTTPDETAAIASLVDDVLADVDVGIVVFDENFDVAWLNAAIERYFGLTPERVVGTDKRTLLEEHIAPLVDDLDAFVETVLATDDDNASTERFECHVTSDDGYEERWLKHCSKPIESGAYAGGQVDLYYDITNQKHEQQLRRERELVQQIFDTAPVGIGVLSPTGDIIRANERADSLLGVTDNDPDEYVAEERTIYDADGNPVPLDEQPHTQVLDTGTPVFDWQCQLEQSNGERRWLSVNAAPLEDAEGDSDRIVVTGKDITQLKEQARRLERQRDELESELDEVFERVSDGFYGLDNDLRFSYINDHAAELLDLSKSDAIGSYVGDTLDMTDSFKHSLVEAAEEGRSVVHEEYYEPLDAWFETAIHPSESGVSVYFRNVTERKQREHELQQYETIIETINDGVYVLDAEGRFVLVNDAYCELTSYDREALLGSLAAMVVNEQTQAAAGRLEDELVAGKREHASLEADVQTADGETIPAEATFAMLPGDGRRRVGVVRDITERKEREQELERQREQLAALNALNDVIRDITEAVIDQSTREKIVAVVCKRLADVASYEFAWFAEVDPQTRSIISGVEAGVDGYLKEIPLSMDSDDPAGRGPAGRAIRTQEIQVVQDALTDSSFEPWYEYSKAYGYRSLAVAPIVYGDTLYGVLGVYADRPKAFSGKEQDVIAQLGEIVGYAIAAVERKQALMSDEITELEFIVPDFLNTIGLDSGVGGTITFDRAVPTGGGAFLEYGTVTEDAIDTLEALVDQLSHFEAVTIVDREAGMAQFELQLSDPPVVSAVAAHGGYLRQARIEDGIFHMRIHLPVTITARRVIDEVKAAYPTTDLVSRRQITRSDDTLTQLQRAVTEDLTGRQRATLEAAVHSGYFEWPRKTTGEELAESFGIAAPTFSQHLRKAQKRVFESLFSSPPA
ncbi:bacterioopsin transcriptional activator [Halalkalicoccus paucihalophilus]|uniref:Bacterioopsin transcriptional activator n=1 Tax=Halalkalicoccus paucihalophilus TaxID=1008153 RepID=A0A151AB04_9EURY|nr:PAS domain S-box protein [Halalkalicoccus paucihalophilus]KYH24774.1 bacterioopsin transcriptional activator [Halalkalicoccus paucihalophilus]